MASHHWEHSIVSLMTWGMCFSLAHGPSSASSCGRSTLYRPYWRSKAFHSQCLGDDLNTSTPAHSLLHDLYQVHSQHFTSSALPDSGSAHRSQHCHFFFSFSGKPISSFQICQTTISSISQRLYISFLCRAMEAPS